MQSNKIYLYKTKVNLNSHKEECFHRSARKNFRHIFHSETGKKNLKIKTIKQSFKKLIYITFT